MTYHPKLIESEPEYKAALRELRDLWALKPEDGTPASDQLNLLAHLIDEYEDQAFPIDIPDPIAAIEFYMEQNGLEQKDLAELLHSRSRASEILSRKARLSLSQIQAIHQAWKIPADILIKPIMHKNPL
ncbi:MAG: transcriptional regulator [Rhodospirillales bacterium]|nr:transcriptional regulator [Rhodospirillales bacterium]